MNLHLVTLNGPLGVGKSWVADKLAIKNPHLDIVRVSWQDPLRKAAMALLGVPNGFSYDEFKKTEYMGKTGRQWMIHLSEDFAKTHDPYFFSVVLCETIRAHNLVRSRRKVIFVADSNGFANELDYVRVQEDIDVLACCIEPLEMQDRRGKPWVPHDSRFNLADKCNVIAQDSSSMLLSLQAALERRGWV